jgi:hypothetical protein
MAFEQNPYNLKLSFVAANDLSTQQFRFVKNTGDVETGTAVVDAIGDTHWTRPIGILQNQPRVYASGKQEAEVTISGITKVVVGDGGGISAGDRIGAGEYGAAVVAATDDPDAAWAVGTAITSGVAGDLITVVINCAVPFKAAKA